jgi:hypothetical protein
LPRGVKTSALTHAFDKLFLFLKDRFAPGWLVQLVHEASG